MRWHQREAEEIFELLKTTPKGISSKEAKKRLEQYGPNVLKEKKKKTSLVMFFDQFKDFMILVLIAAALISGVIGELVDTIAIIVIVVLNAVIGFVQEFRAEKAMEALKMMAAPTATVLRDGMITNIGTSQLVPGDIVLLKTGKVVPADLRLIKATQLKVEEAPLTGESVPVEKHIKSLRDEMIPLGDQKNMAYKGTTISYGRGTGVVVSTGMETEFGKIATLLQKEEGVKTPLQKRLAKFGQRLALTILAISALVFGHGILRGESVILMFLTAVSLAVAAIPEALPAVITISLALGAKKMVKQNALVRKLPAVETLGSVTYICSDKTGTLTQNKMTVEEIYVDGEIVKSESLKLKSQEKLSTLDSRLSTLFRAMALSNDAMVDKDSKIIGDPTEVALYVASKEAGFSKHDLLMNYPRLAENPFDPDRKCMTTFHQDPQEKIVSFTKGAVEVLIDKSAAMLTKEGLKNIEEKEIQEIRRINARMAADGLRMLGIAMRRWGSLPANMSPENVERDLTILGLVGIMDPPREEAREAVGLCKSAGIRPVMITGDHPATARTIAKKLDIIDDRHAVITGSELERLPLEELEKRVEDIKVYARVAPEQKLKIVKALQDKGQFVAMTGDGVNDAPALKRADIGIAMGITGTEVSKEASHMILLDDNFATIVKAVEEGRRIFDNIRKFIKYIMASNLGEIWTIFLAPFLGLPIPLLPIHILWINLVTDGLPALALAAEPEEKSVMERPPRHPRESIFAHGLGMYIIWVGFLMGGATLFAQAWSITAGNAHWQTMVFTVLCLNQMGHVLAVRSERESLFIQGIFSNKPLIGSFILVFVLQMATIYVPFLNPIFKTSPLSAGELIFTLILSSVVFFAVEIEKWWKRSTGKENK